MRKISGNQLKRELGRFVKKRANSFADKYSPFQKYMAGKTSTQRKSIIKNVDEMYKTKPDAAIGLTIYGRLNELSGRLEHLIDKGEFVGLLIGGLGILKSTSSYDKILPFVRGEYRREALIALANINPKRTIPLIREFVESSSDTEAVITLKTIFDDLIKNQDYASAERLRSVLNEIRRNIGTVVYNSAKEIN